jgi:hypothetical protein
MILPLYEATRFSGTTRRWQDVSLSVMGESFEEAFVWGLLLERGWGFEEE